MASPIGFSQSTSLPALIAARAIGTCQWSGVLIITASTRAWASNSRKSVVRKVSFNRARSHWFFLADAATAGIPSMARRQRSTSHRATVWQ